MNAYINGHSAIGVCYYRYFCGNNCGNNYYIYYFVVGTITEGEGGIITLDGVGISKRWSGSSYSIEGPTSFSTEFSIALDRESDSRNHYSANLFVF